MALKEKKRKNKSNERIGFVYRLIEDEKGFKGYK